MLHFLKYLLLTLFLFAVLNLFRSNLDTVVSIKFQIPLIHEWLFPPVSLNYLLLTGFSAGILFAAFIGAFRFSTIREKKREIKILRKELGDRENTSKEIPPPSRGGGEGEGGDRPIV